MESMRSRCAVGVLALAAMAGPGWALTYGPTFTGSFTDLSLGQPSGVPANLGGLTFLDNDTILIGGAANGSGGQLYTVDVVRDGTNHITGFAGAATLFGTAPYNDGGVTFGPGGVLFVTGYPVNTLMQYKPGSTSPDKTISLSVLVPSVASSVGSVTFVPAGFAGAGQFKIASFNGNTWYTGTLTPDGSGTNNITALSSPVSVTGGPEGIVYIKAGNVGFANDGVLISEWSSGKVGAYDIDANGDPILVTRRDFITNLTGAEGAVIDPLTGDFLFSTYGGGNQVVVVRGFAAPEPVVPEPASLGLLAAGAVGLLLRRRR